MNSFIVVSGSRVSLQSEEFGMINIDEFNQVLEDLHHVTPQLSLFKPKEVESLKVAFSMMEIFS